MTTGIKVTPIGDMPLPPMPAFRESTADFGPELPTSDTPTPEPPKVNQKTPPKSTSKVFGNLGQNVKARGAARKLTDSDHERIVSLYKQLAGIAKLFHPRLATALDMSAVDCTDAWFRLAEKNDSVRARICAFVEGGDWGKVVLAHVPILMAVIPEQALANLMMRGMNLFGKNSEVMFDLSDFGEPREN